MVLKKQDAAAQYINSLETETLAVNYALAMQDAHLLSLGPMIEELKKEIQTPRVVALSSSKEQEQRI